jgi:hypothetical protein
MKTKSKLSKRTRKQIAALAELMDKLQPLGEELASAEEDNMSEDEVNDFVASTINYALDYVSVAWAAKLGERA